MNERVCIFWDNSNIFISSRFAATRRGVDVLAERGTRIQFDALFQLAHANREVISAVCVGSVPPELAGVWKKLEETGIQVELFERGRDSGQEQGVDQCLQVHMLRALSDVGPPATCVLLTGDGAGYESGVGFQADLERMHSRGWGIEVLSWNQACNTHLRAWAQEVGVYVPLDDYYESITFEQHGRRSRPLSLMRRPLARPRAGK